LPKRPVLFNYFYGSAKIVSGETLATSLAKGAQMDSRIREIEQWIAEAKHDLGERGREAYLEKLYLLDAEIRNVIRENGVPPQSASPRAAVRRVRRWHAPQALASGAAFGIMLLAASTVYFASPGAKRGEGGG
jgi:hypothetical protein